MDFQDAGVTWDNVVLATEALVPYVLEWRPGSEEDGEAECVVLVLMKRAGGVLLAMPVHFLPEDLISQGNSGQDDMVFGPSFQARVPASILEGGVVSPTGMEVDVLVIDCMAQVLDSMRLFGPEEEVVYNFDEDSPFAFPLADALLPQVFAVGRPISRCQGRVLHPSRGGGASRDPCKAAKRSARKGFAFRRWCKAANNSIPCSGHEGSDGVFASYLFSASSDLRQANSAGGQTTCGDKDPAHFSQQCAWSASQCHSSQPFSACSRSPSTTSNCTKGGPWFVGFPRRLQAGGAASPGRREAGDLALICPDLRRCYVSKGSDGTEQSPNFSGVSDCECPVGSYVGVDRRLIFSRHQGSNYEGEASTGVGSASGLVFQLRLAEHVPENGANQPCFLLSGRAPSQGSVRSPLLGEVRRIWPTSGTWSTSVSGDVNLRLPHGGQCAGSHGWCCPPCSDPGTIMSGWWEDGIGNPFVPSGRPSCLDFCEPPDCCDIEGKVFCPLSRSALDHLRPCLPQGAGDYHSEEDRAYRRKGCFREFIRQPGLLLEAKGKSCQEERERKRLDRKVRRSRRLDEPSTSTKELHGDLEEQESNPLRSTIDFCTWAICLPRWLMKCRTKFGWHLKRSFTAIWSEPSLASTTAFPLPAPHPGCFAGGGPKLSKRRLLALVRKRLLHQIVFALNYMYLGRHATLAELGRRPNTLQSQIFKRLSSLLAVCGDGSEKFPMVPGRSGPELGAEILQLEKFGELHPELGQSYVQPGTVTFKPDPRLLPSSDFPELEPYKSLTANRLKLVGRGEWPMEKFLSGVLWLPFQEPRFLLHGERVDESAWPKFHGESREENLQLAKLWDSRGLLKLFKTPVCEGHFSRVFNAYKSPTTDRQIGDRRIPNSRERAIDGPSKHLPPGFLLTNFRVVPYKQQLFGSVTDRRDFYHQVKVTDERARANMLPFSYKAPELSDLAAFEKGCCDPLVKRGSKLREVVGDGFGEAGVGAPGTEEDVWHPCFASLFQGDHLGVELALQAHEEVLIRGGLLQDPNRVKGHALFPISERLEGLIIDDYFSLGCEPIGTEPLNTFAAQSLARARSVYEKEGLAGSPEKDVQAEVVFKAAGAEIVSCLKAVRDGVTTVGAPFSKRVALSALSLRVARQGLFSAKLAAKLAGSWTSVLLYRRCLTAVVDDLFKVGAEAEKVGRNYLTPLSRKLAEELSILSILAPVAVSNIAVSYDEKVYASDASLGLGAVVSAKIDSGISEILWLGSDKKGCYSRLDSESLALLAAAGEEVHESFGTRGTGPGEKPQKAPLLYFDFVEFFGGSGRVSECMREKGFSVAPPLDLSESRHYD